MPNDEQRQSLSEIIIETLSNWAGWPEVDWLVMSIHRKHRFPHNVISNKIAELVSAKRIALVEHNNQAVLRME